LVTASVPEEGQLQLGAITLPAGKRVRAGFEPAVPVAWVTRQPVPDAGRVWAGLSAMHQETGLVPFLLGHLRGYPSRPWDDEEFDLRGLHVVKLTGSAGVSSQRAGPLMSCP